MNFPEISSPALLPASAHALRTLEYVSHVLSRRLAAEAFQKNSERFKQETHSARRFLALPHFVPH